MDLDFGIVLEWKKTLSYNRRNMVVLAYCYHFYFLWINTYSANANSADPDQMPHIAASDLGQHCLPMSNIWDTRQ